MSRQKELDTGPKSIQQIEFVKKLKNLDDNGNATDAGHGKSMLAIFGKSKETRLTFSQGSVTTSKRQGKISQI